MDVLRAKLYEIEQLKATGTSPTCAANRSAPATAPEKIRTYNFPDDRVTDHRLGKKFHNIDKILEGNLDPIVDAFSVTKSS